MCADERDRIEAFAASHRRMGANKDCPRTACDGRGRDTEGESSMPNQHTPGLSAEERFWPKVTKTDTCWLWTGTGSGNGYGRFHWNGRSGPAHRFVYELFVGLVPEGLQLDHLCRNRRCVNPDHLEAVTSRENTLRGEGPTARHSRKTHCPQGHPLTVENIRRSEWLKHGHRVCAICARAHRRAYDKRQKEKVA